MTWIGDSQRAAALSLDRTRILGDVVAVLRGVNAVHYPGSRGLLLRELSHAFGDTVDFKHFPALQEQLVEVAGQCLERDGGLRTLADCLALVELGAAGRPMLLRLADEWQVMQQLSDYDVRWLKAELAGQRIPPEIRRHVVLAGVLDVSDHCADLWQLFAHLAGVSPVRGTVPAWLGLLQRLEPYISQRPRLRDLLAALQDVWGVTERQSGRSLLRQAGAGGTAHLIIQIEKYFGKDDTYLVTHWHQVASIEWQPIRGGDIHVSHDELEAAVDRLVFEAERRWADQVEPVMIEFVLPFQLLDLPVEQWNKELDSEMPSPLSAEYPLVIRSLERLENLNWHRVWRLRWQAVTDRDEPGQVHCDKPGQTDAQLEALLKREGGVVVLVLSEPPRPRGSGSRRLLAGLRAGLPAIIWHRDETRREELSAVVNSMIDESLPETGLVELPRLVAKLRQSAWAEAPSTGGGHIGHGLVLLWDDPNRQPGRTGYAGHEAGEARV